MINEARTASEKRPALPVPLLLAGTGTFFGYTSFFLAVVALPLYLEKVMGLRASEVGGIIGASYLANFLAYFTVGPAADRRGATQYVVLSGLGLAVASGILLIVRSPWALAGATLWRGVAMSAYVVANFAFAGTVVDPERRGAQLGLFGMFNNAAAGIAPPLGAWLFAEAGWEFVFGAAAVCGLIAGGTGLLLRPYETVSPAKRESTKATGLTGLRVIMWPLATVVGMGVALGAVGAFMPGYLASRGVANPGFFYTAQVSGLLALRAYAGSLSDRYGRIPVACTGLLLIGVSVLTIAWVRSDLQTIADGLLAGIGMALFTPVVFAWLFDVTRKEKRGVTSAAYFTAQDLGRGSGSILTGLASQALGPATPFIAGGGTALLVGGWLLAKRWPSR